MEIIGNEDKLFYHISIHYVKEGKAMPLAFTPQKAKEEEQADGLSVNWDKYCPTAKDCLAIATERFPQGRTTDTHGVGHFITKEVRAIEIAGVNLDAQHAPIDDNNAHALIINIPKSKPKDPYNEARKKLSQIFKWDIKPALPPTT